MLEVVGGIAQKYGMKVVVEPLSRRECNFIHTVEEGAAVARMSGQPSVGTLVDLYHFWNNEEELSALPEQGERLFHVHFARQGDRLAPRIGDEDTLKRVAEALGKCPKVERISVVCFGRSDAPIARLMR